MKKKAKKTWIIVCGLILVPVMVVRAEVRPTAQITFIVKDDFEKPVANVDVSMSTFHHWEPREGFGKDILSRYSTKTDSTGKAVLTGRSLTGEFNYGTYAATGYYLNGRNSYCFNKKSLGRWEPWNPTIEIIFKPVLNPIPYIGGAGRKKIPKRETAIGFDLFKNDWIAPYGKGKSGDIIFTLEEKIPFEISGKPYDYRLKISFPNKGDGIQTCYVPRDSGELPMPRYAPKEGYESNLELKKGYDKNGFFNERDDQNFFIRVRTVLDKDGKVKSALYGKVEGNIKFDRTNFFAMNYGLNPNPLDVNMEFDPEKNLRFPSWQKTQKQVEAVAEANLGGPAEKKTTQ
ncbi:MAG: Ig-like domain-containing protein [Puniceicoccales bacterium]|jgi:hypothetical protein|nr:Ig-like domain-containing protein [Puniceicoccales bacterium]